MDEINSGLDQLNYETAPVSNMPPEAAVAAGPGRGRKLKIIGVAAAVIIVLSGGGYFAYAQYFNNPERIWQTAASNLTASESGRLELTGSYTEKLEDQEGLGEMFFDQKEITLSFNAGGNFTKKPDQDVDFDVTSSFGAKLGAFNISLEVESRKIGNNLFYKMSDIPFLGLLGSPSPEEKEAEWIKIDLAQKPENSNPQDFLTKISEEQIKQIREAFAKVTIFKPGSLVGSETVNGVNTWHFAASIDKEALKNYLETAIKIVDPKIIIADYKPLIDKLDFRKAEVWIGKSDRQIREVVLETSFPSFIQGSMGSSRDKSRDAKRLADVRQMQTALELFYNDNNRYPTATNGFPTADDGRVKFSTFLPVPPKAPTPPDGKCSREENFYWYEQVNSGQSYKLRFCIGNTTGGYGAGILEASPAGIAQKEMREGGSAEILNPFLDIPFNSTFTLKLSLSNLGQEVQIEEPQGALDYSEILREKTRASIDARELSNVRQLQTALELYYNDENSYPDNLSRLAPSYISPTLPAPLNRQNECSAISDQYDYRRISRDEYSFKFCLGSDTGGLGKGPHTATPRGIQ